MLCEIARFAVPGCALAAAIWMLARYFAVLRPRCLLYTSDAADE